MNTEERPAGTMACLDHGLLTAYSLGTLPERMLERVARHLADCPSCEAALESVRGVEDAFVRNLRRHLRGDVPRTRDGSVGTGSAASGRPDFPVSVSAALGPLPRRFGKYEILEKLAVGGMSIVFKARQFHPDRLVALKIPHYAPVAGTDTFARFQLEIEAIARLQHDHIVRIDECGEEEGLRYFSMEYLEGGSLAKRVAGAPLPEREAAQLVLILARTVHFAHQQGIIHRDLKPANVLLGAGSSVKLTDFGLAKWLDGDDGLTQSHAILGTAKYMAPEQARGDAAQVGVLTDVYGLGTILYECLTGRAPFQGPTHAAIMRQVEATPPVPPSRLRRGLCRTLEAICLKCLEKDPRERYASAERLANDLEHWLNQEPTEARPRRWPARLYGQVRRHWVLTAAAVLALLAAITIPVVAYVRDPARQRESAEQNLRRQQPATLIDDSGRATWFQVRTDPASTNVGTAVDGAFSVAAFKLGLVELLPDPQGERYRFSAEVRQDNGEQDNARVGIYFADTARTTANGQVVHEFCGVGFNEFFAHPARLDFKPSSVVQFSIQRHVEPVVAPMDHTISGPWEHHFSRRPLNWRKVAVEVTPEKIRTLWDNQSVGELTRSELMKRAQLLLRGPVALGGLRPHLPVQGALGVYVFNATASFRSVVVEPLGGGQ